MIKYITGWALMVSAILYFTLVGRVEGVWVYTGITFFIIWMGTIFVLGMCRASAEEERLMEEEWERRREVE